MPLWTAWSWAARALWLASMERARLTPHLPARAFVVRPEGLLGLARPAKGIDESDPGHRVPFDLQGEATVAQVRPRVRVRGALLGHALDLRLDVALQSQIPGLRQDLLADPIRALVFDVFFRRIHVNFEAHPAGGLLGEPVQEVACDRDGELAVLDVDGGDLLAQLDTPAFLG